MRPHASGRSDPVSEARPSQQPPTGALRAPYTACASFSVTRKCKLLVQPPQASPSGTSHTNEIFACSPKRIKGRRLASRNPRSSGREGRLASFSKSLRPFARFASPLRARSCSQKVDRRKRSQRSVRDDLEAGTVLRILAWSRHGLDDGDHAQAGNRKPASVGAKQRKSDAFFRATWRRRLTGKSARSWKRARCKEAERSGALPCRPTQDHAAQRAHACVSK